MNALGTDYPSAVLAFQQSDPAKTVAYYDHLLRRGPIGQVAFGLFRASKRSDLAKSYRRREHRSNAYDAKNESLKYLNAALGRFADRMGIAWGWGIDEHQELHRHILYVDLPNGQASFHSATNCDGPRYEFGWDGQHKTVHRVLNFCDYAAAGPARTDTDVLMPFGRHVGVPVSELRDGYKAWFLDWGGQHAWPYVVELLGGARSADGVGAIPAGARDEARTESAPAFDSIRVSGQAAAEGTAERRSDAQLPAASAASNVRRRRRRVRLPELDLDLAELYRGPKGEDDVGAAGDEQARRHGEI